MISALVLKPNQTIMKKAVTFLVVILMASGLQSFSQTGIGIGSRGLNVRTDPDSKYGLIVRSGFAFSILPLRTYIETEAAFVRRYHFTERTQIYGGIGIASKFSYRRDELTFGYGGFIPVGLEYFPFRHHPNFSLSFESGYRFLSFGNFDDHRFNHYGLVEVTFYLNGQDRDYYEEL